MHSIRVKITAVTVAAILTSLLVFCVIGYTTLSRENDRSSVETMNLISENVAQSLDAYLNSLKQSVDMAIHIAEDALADVSLADFGVVDGHAPADPAQAQALAALLKAQSDAVEAAFGSIANYSSGVVTYYYCLNDAISTTEHGFFYSKMGSTRFEPQPPLISSSLDPNDIAHTTWYYTPLAQRRPVWIGPYLAHFLREAWTVSYVAPIYIEGVPVGVMGMDILLDTMIGRVRPVRVYDTGFACLLNADGGILYHPKYEIGTYPEAASDVLQSATFRRRSSGTELIRYVSEGERRQLVFSTLTNGLKLVVTAPVREVISAWSGLVKTILLVGIGILAVFLLLTLLMVRAITRPLHDLAVASKKLAAGDYDVSLGYRGRDEVGVLTDSFRQMRDYLQYYISDLNSRAYSDAMTGVRNKAAFERSAEELNARLRRGEAQEFAVVLFDCNRLKLINDEFGHDRGDVYLQTACRSICRVYAHSPIFRLGGDEFAALLQQEDYANRDALLEVFDRAVEEINAGADNAWGTVSVSKGMAVYRPGEDEDVSAVLRRADKQMYEDKRKYKQTAVI